MSEKMKDSGVDWIGEIPEGWEVSKIKYVAELDPVKSEIIRENFIGKKVTFLPMDKLKKGHLILDSVADFIEVFSSYNYFAEGDILFAKVTPSFENGNIGIAKNLRNGIGFGSSEIYTLRAHNIDTNFLYYWLQNQQFKSEAVSNMYGVAGLKRVPAEFIKNHVILLPISRVDQKAVADYLDKQTSKFDQAQKLLKDEIERLRAYKKSLIYETVTKGLDKNVQFKDSGVDWIGEIPVGWGVSKLKFLSEGKLQYGANVEGVDFDKKLPRYIRITDITGDNKLKEKGKQSLPRDIATPYLLQKGDILFARSGATVGKTFLFESEESAAFAGYLIKFTPNQEKVDSKFVFYMTLGYGYENWKNSIFSQATIQNIGADKYGELKIAMPSLVEQLDIVKFLDEKTKKIDKIIKIKEEQVINLLKQQKNLIYEMVTGKKNIELGISNGSNG